jgi:hypothetical protein
MKETNRNGFSFVVLLAALLAVGLGCSAITAGTESSEKAVGRFHQQYNDGKFDEIYDDGSKEFKDSVQIANWAGMLRHVSGRLGKVKSKSQTAWNVKTAAIGVVVELNYDTEFENGSGKEKFNFVIVNDEAKLLGYEVESEKLKD